MNNKTIIAIISFIITIITYILTRFIYINIYHIVDIPNIITCLSSALICLFILQNRLFLSIITSISNIIGFVIANIFNKTNYFIYIWIGIYVLIIVIAYIIDRIVSRETNKGK